MVFIQIRNSCSSKDTIKKLKKLATAKEKTLSKHVSDKDAVSQKYKIGWNANKKDK